MKEKEAIFTRHKFNTKFKDADMDFMMNWAIGISQIIGMAPSQIFYAVHDVRNGNPTDWRKGFLQQAQYQIERAKTSFNENQRIAIGQSYLGAAYAYRAALQYTNPNAAEFNEFVGQMEKTFQRGAELLDVPVRPVEIPFENTTLPGYLLEHDQEPRPVLMMVGGSDTFREDLFYFAGYPGWKRGYNVIMVDLPGQGVLPNRGQTFRVDMDTPIRTILDWLEKNASIKDGQVAIYGVSGGGYFTMQAVISDPRIKAWIAGTPIFDITEVYKHELGNNTLKTPGWLLNFFMKISGSFNESAKINLDKYAWQFGTSDFKSAIDAVMAQARTYDYSSISIPSLFLVTEGEGAELKRQAAVVYDDMLKRGVDVTLRKFTALEGADAHSVLNNMRLAHLVVFDWLDRVFQNEVEDVRLLC